ncbi:BTAD domain-containing putative transcriptional regulator [Streptomyces sp. NPDC058653]|uniref:AfsR/SARP family transcriptional regulator n=1 Tax=Streptomyces sp. NPDC058653 TaxID=3346576 RepID=UPI003650B579
MGQLSLRWNGSEKIPSAGKPRTVLALLLLNEKRPVTTGSLITELWGEDPPRSALTTLQTYILQLRKCLAAMSGQGLSRISRNTLVTWPCGYLLRVSDDATSDLSEFRRLTDVGRSAEREGDIMTAVSHFREALGLWRGPLFADIEHGPVLRAEAVRLEECRLSLIERCVEGDLILGRHREAVSELSALIAQYPYHEELAAQLMIALVRSGRRQDALAVFRSLRERMIEDLGLEPGGRLHRLQYDVLSGEVEESGRRSGTPHATQLRGAQGADFAALT